MIPTHDHRKMPPEVIRNIFVGLNDGLVGTLGSVSGFFAAFHHPQMVFIATLIEATASTLSMAAGSYVAVDSETESRSVTGDYGADSSPEIRSAHAWRAALTVGLSYILGAIVTAAPLVVGATSSVPSWFTAGLTLAVVSYLLASRSGMNIKRRVITNVCILAITAGVTYFVGELVQRLYHLNP